MDISFRKNKLNCLNTIRLIVALEIFYGHAKEHLDVPSYPILDAIARWIPGVPVFFFLSGFLIWKSIEASKNYTTFLRKRAARIFPELWVAVLVSTLSIIVLYRDHINWGGLFAFSIAQSTLFQFWTPSFLRGFGCGTPNGSLWTITVTLQFYIFSWLIYKKLKGKEFKTWLLVLVSCVLLGVAIGVIGKWLPEIVNKFISQTIMPYLWIFILGSFVSEYFDIICNAFKKYWFVWLLGSIIWTFLIPFDIVVSKYPLIQSILFFGASLGIAYAIPQINLRVDISYGLYIYHMIIINIMIELGYVKTWYSAVISLAISLISAYLSTVVVGNHGRKLFIKS